MRWLKGVLLYGPPGCGKTLLVNAVAAEYGARVHSVMASHIFGAYTGSSHARPLLNIDEVYGIYLYRCILTGGNDHAPSAAREKRTLQLFQPLPSSKRGKLVGELGYA